MVVCQLESIGDCDFCRVWRCPRRVKSHLGLIRSPSAFDLDCDRRSASLTYVKEQMGHSSIQITVDTYGHLIPGADIAWVDKLDEAASAAETTAQPSATSAQPAPIENSEQSLEVIETIGEPGRTRTCNPLIKRPSKDN
jgi:hypothetical protein